MERGRHHRLAADAETNTQEPSWSVNAVSVRVARPGSSPFFMVWAAAFGNDNLKADNFGTGHRQDWALY